MRFLGLPPADDVLDSKTVCSFRELLTDKGLTEPLFYLFLKELEKLNLIINEGKIADTSFIEVPIKSRTYFRIYGNDHDWNVFV